MGAHAIGRGHCRACAASIRGVIQRKIQRVGRDATLLVAASVQGYEFDSAVVAEVLGVDSGEAPRFL
jgi:hypothetical protein